MENETYWEQAFQTWFAHDRIGVSALYELLPPLPSGERPGAPMIKAMIEKYGWNERADTINSTAIQKNNEFLVQKKSEMLQRHAEQAFRVAGLAMEKLEEGFDSSSSAVAALKWATEEERTARGIQGMMVEISKLPPDKLMDRAMKLLQRRTESVDGEIVEENANNSSQTTD